MKRLHPLSSSTYFTRSLSFATLTLLTFCLLPSALGQSATATLSGTVEDQNGAVIPGATITMVNSGTALQRQATTNDEGQFTIPLLPPGSYTVRAEGQGFAPVQVNNVVLNVGDQKALQIQLKAGDVNATVQVTSEASLISGSPAVATVVDRQFVANIPLSGRSFQALISLSPGVVIAKSDGSNQGQFSVNGQRTNSNYFMVDGVSANIGTTASTAVSQFASGSLPALSTLGGTSNLVSVDALQEFKIQTSSYAPEFGRTPGGQISILTRSGTNNFHGVVFHYLRNDVFDANDWFANRQGLRKPPLRQNDFGGVVGGPVLLPRLGEGEHQPWYNGKNRTFFFFSYEGLRLRQPVVGVTQVPSLTLRQTAPPAFQPLLRAFPLPNGSDFGNGLAQFSASYSDSATLNAISIRVDHTLSQKATLFGRYNYAPSETSTRGANTSNLAVVLPLRVATQTFTSGISFWLTARISNDLRFNYSKTTGKSFYSPESFAGSIPPADAAFFPSFATRADSQFIFALQFGARPQFRVGNNIASSARQINVVDTLTWVSGSHEYKFGIDYRRLFPVYGPQQYQEQINVLSVTNLNNSVVSGSITSRNSARPILNNFSAFVQDTWKARRRFTLTYGVRWELNPPPSDANGNLPFAFTANGFANPAAFAVAPQGTALYKTTYNNFAPRVGGAYQISEKSGIETVLRGGFGIFYDLGSNQSVTGVTFYPFAKNRTLTNVSFPLSAANASFPNPGPPFAVLALYPNLKLPYTIQWNAALEQSLGKSQAVSISYVGALGRRLLQQKVYVSPTTTFSQVNTVTNSATSDYHALQAQFQRRLSRGVQALASYTWGHSIDDASNDSGDNDLARGPSNFDVRHIFSGAVSYNIPSGNVKNFAKGIIGNWSLDSIVRAQSARPLNIISSLSFVNLLTNIRPDLTAGIPLYINAPNAPGGRQINNTVDPSRPRCKGPFCPPPAGRQGSLGRNALRGFPVSQVDATLRRQFNLSEALKLQFRIDVFNVFNHPNFGDPDNSLTSGTFGQATSMLSRSLGSGGTLGGFSPLFQIGGPRSVQFSLKLEF